MAQCAWLRPFLSLVIVSRPGSVIDSLHVFLHVSRLPVLHRLFLGPSGRRSATIETLQRAEQP